MKKERRVLVKQGKGRLIGSTVCLSIAGLISVLNGAWFVFGEHPFHRTGGYSREFGMTEAELNAINPLIADWGRHVSDQVGSVSIGWGLFIVILAIFGVLRRQKLAWLTLWIAGTPTIFYSALGEFIQFRTFDEGSLYSFIVLIFFLVGMLLPITLFMKQRSMSDSGV
jgi:hypothetical protein